jgi:hypothetical protein
LQFSTDAERTRKLTGVVTFVEKWPRFRRLYTAAPEEQGGNPMRSLQCVPG